MKIYDLVIIGGGAAGMMASIAAKTFHPSAKVVILEKNDACGKKLLITGKGRCNITTSNTNIQEFIEIIGRNGRWLRDALNILPIDKTLEFFTSIGVAIQEERGNRIFPDSENASYVRDKIVKKISDLGIEVAYQSNVAEIQYICGTFEVNTKNNKHYHSANLIIATGGLSYPSTGSTGDGYVFAEKLGHTIIKPIPSLVGLKSKDNWPKKLAGLTLKNVKIEVYQNNKKHYEKFGDALFTHIGISGPIILDSSKHIHHLMNSCLETVYLHMDLKPAVTHEQLDLRLQRICQEEGKKNLKGLITQLLPGKLVDIFIEINHLSSDKKLSEIKKEERLRIINSLKKLIITLSDVEGFDRAIITAGGITLKDVNPQNMQSKKIENLYFAGEVLDLDGPTGGFNLQIAWSTGYLAGKSITCS